MDRHRFFVAAHPLRAPAEAWLVGLAIMLWFGWLRGRQPEVLTIGPFFLCGTAGLWAVARTRVPKGGPVRQLEYEVGVAAVLSGAMVLLSLSPWAAPVVAVWDRIAPLSRIIGLLFACTGLGYLLCRGALRAWLAWDRLRRRHMRWALTHAHLMLVLMAAAGGTVALLAIFPLNSTAALQSAGTHGWLGSLTARFLFTVFPVLSLITILTAAALVIVLPPSALFSYVIARQTTGRLETLARGTAALRRGEYNARVAVEGEDELAQLQTDFNAMAETLDGTLAELQNERDHVAALLRARRELVANVSHELRTPVATVRATLDSVLEHWPAGGPDETRCDLERMEGEVLRLQGLIDDLFTLARAEVDALRLEVGPVDAGAALREMVDAFAPLAWASGRVELVAQIQAGLPPVLADGERLRQVIANLLRNAVRYTPPGGIVVAGAAVETATGAVGEEGDKGGSQQSVDDSAADRRLLISVRDTGTGIAPADLPHIWSRFYRGAPATRCAPCGKDGSARHHEVPGVGSDEAPASRRDDGAGLGLALVKELSEAMGGTVAVESIAGQGSCFTISLPVCQEGRPGESSRETARAG
jgi:signal transduction histidine kinase